MAFKKVRVEWKGKLIEGILIPYEGKEAKDYIFIKLPNGYNVGIKKSEARLEVIEEVEEKGVEGKRGKEAKVKKGEVAVIGCGGTIRSRVDYKTGAVYPAISAEFLRKNYSEVESIASIETHSLFNIFSENINAYHWEKIAEAVYEKLKENKGVVVLHGTDTMHYTASAIAFAIQELNKPVVLTGSQRSSDRPSTDAKLNFLNAVYSAKQGFGEVVIAMHGTINDDYVFLHRGVKARKMHTSRRDAFKSINIRPLAKVDYRRGVFEKVEESLPLREAQRLGKLRNKFNENIGMLYVYPGLKPELVEKFDMFDGVVVVGTGLGHVPIGKEERIKSIYEELKGLREKGIPLVITSQTLYGRINLNVYRTGRELLELGVIGNECDMLPEVAYVKLSWVMGYEKDEKRIKEIMEKNLVGEITLRSSYEGYESYG